MSKPRRQVLPSSTDAIFGSRRVAADGQQSDTAKHQAVKTSNGPTIQKTLYLTAETSERLERSRAQLLLDHGVKTTNSEIAEQAIRRALENLPKLAQLLKGGTS